MNKKKYKFLITGHSRSGTGYMSELMKSLGYDVGHEKYGEDGISSWVHAHPTLTVPWYRTKSRSGLGFEKVFHVVREPMDVISSTLTDLGGYKLRKRVVRIPDCKRICDTLAHSLLSWTDLIDKEFPEREIVRVETADKWMPKILTKLGYTIKDNSTFPPKNVNSRRHRTIDFEELSESLRLKITEYRLKYGYTP